MKQRLYDIAAFIIVAVLGLLCGALLVVLLIGLALKDVFTGAWWRDEY